MSEPLKLNKLMLSEYAAEVMVYFEKHKLIDVVQRLLAEIALEYPRPEDPQLWLAQNITRIAADIYNKYRWSCYMEDATTALSQCHYPGRFLYRVVIFGRRGSGRKTQARALVKRFNLVFIDAEHLIAESLNDTNDASKMLQAAFATDNVHAKSIALGKIIALRLLQMDCLRQGWVLVNYPCKICEFRTLFEQFKIPPNKLIYLQCPERLAMRRSLQQPYLGCPQNNCKYMEEEMHFFHKNAKEIDEYLASRYETIYIDATPCYELVKINIWAQLERTPYMMGFKT